MAYASVTYPNQTGTTTSYSIPFGYIDESDIAVTVEGVSTSFTFTSTSVINISPAPTGDVVVYRTTPIEDKVTTFVDGSAFLAAEANQQNDQFLFALQEGIDSLGSAQASAAAALASETAAALSEAAAAASESAAATSESNALTYKNAAASSASAANLSDISATSAANTATAKAVLTAADAVATAADRAAVAADKSTVDGYKVAAAASAAAALVSENAAAASAAALPNGAATGTGKVPQWNGSAWVGTNVGTGDLISTNNLSDLANAATARANLGAGTGNGTVTSITAGTGLTGGTITTSGTIAVDVGTAANKIVQLNGSAQLPAVDGSLLTGLSATDLTARSQIALTNMRLMLNSAVTTGALAGGYQWELSSDEWGATSTNETYTAGSPNYYANPGSFSQIAQGTGTIIGDMTNNGGTAAAFDGTTSQGAGAAAAKGASQGYVGKDWGSGNSYIITKFSYWASTDQGITNGSSGRIRLFGSNSSPANATAGTALYDSGTVTDSNGYTLTVTSGITTTTAYRYHWLCIDSDGSASVYCAEAQFFESLSPANMTLIPPASTTVSTAPSYMDAYCLWKDDSGTAVLGTDLTIELSRDGGTTWSTATITTLAAYDGTYSAIRGRANVSSQPSGTSMTMRIKTLNTKAQRVAAPAIYAE